MCTYSQYLIQQGIDKGREEGREEGDLQATLRTQLNILAAMLKRNFSKDIILECLGIDEKRLGELKDILQHQQPKPETI